MKKYKSKLEANVHKILGAGWKYEPKAFPYTIPASEHKYTPDFSNGTIYVETKGILEGIDRKKMILVKQQYPDLRIVMLFGNSNNRIYKGSPTTYGEWATKEGIEWYDVRSPETWSFLKLSRRTRKLRV